MEHPMGEWPDVTADDGWMILRGMYDFLTERTRMTEAEGAAYARRYLHSLHRVMVVGLLDDPLVLNCAGLSVREVVQMQHHLTQIAVLSVDAA